MFTLVRRGARRGLATKRSVRATRSEPEPTLALEELIAARGKQLGEAPDQVVEIREGVATCTGLPNARIGDLVQIQNVKGYVLSLERNLAHIATFGQVSEIGAKVDLLSPDQQNLAVPKLLPGQAVDALGQPLHSLLEVIGREAQIETQSQGIPTGHVHINGVLDRDTLNEQLHTRILPLDTLFPISLGQRIAVAGPNADKLREVALEIIANQVENKQIDACVYLAVGHEPHVAHSVLASLQSRGCLDKTMMVAASSRDNWVLRSLASSTALTIAEEAIRDSDKNVLLVCDDLGAIGAALSRLEQMRYLSQTKVKSRWSQPHKWLERVGKRSASAGGGSITAVALLPVDHTLQSDQVQDAIASQVDGVVFLSNKQGCKIKAIEKGIPVPRGAYQHKVLAKLSNEVRLQAYQAAQMEENAQIAKQLGLDHRLELDMNDWLEVANILRAVFEQDIRKPFAQRLGEQIVVLYVLAKGLCPSSVTTSNAQSFFMTLLQVAAEGRLLDQLDTIGPSQDLDEAFQEEIQIALREASKRFVPR